MPRFAMVKSSNENTFIFKSKDLPSSRGIGTIGTNIKFRAAQLFSTRLTYKQLVKNFPKVFPNSEYRKLKITNLKYKGEKSKKLHTITRVKSSTRDYEFIVNIVINRKNTKEPWNLGMKGELRCTCQAFHYYLAYPDARVKMLYGKVQPWNKVKNKVKNPKIFPSLCKHGMRALGNLIIEGLVNR